MARMYQLTHERLLEVLDYDPATGAFAWKVARSNRVKIGSRAGVHHPQSGGRYIAIDGEKFMAHRLAFFYANKRWPNTDVRPLDGDYDNSAISNLVEVSRVELAHQRSRVSTNTSGFAGVSRAQRGKWQSKITWNYEQIGLGANFDTAEDAGELYEEAARRLKSVSSVEEKNKVVADLKIWRRQRAAWKYLARSHPEHIWNSFEEFCATVSDFPKMKYSLAPRDASLPLGPDNWQWASAQHDLLSTKDRVAYNRANREANRNHFRSRDFKKNYGIDYSDYQRMLLEQKGVCAICKKPETKLQNGEIRLLSVDHNHATGTVRGLLCANCNLAVGYACDSPEVLRAAADYVEYYNRPKWTTPVLTDITHTALGQQLLMEAAGHG